MTIFILHTETFQEPYESVCKLLENLHNVGLTMNWENYELFKAELVFDRHKLTSEGVNTSQEEIKAVINTGKTENISELRSFISLVNYNARYIPNFLNMVKPLWNLTRKEQSFVFTPKERTAFYILKKHLCMVETLGYFDIHAKTCVIADASLYKLAVLSSFKSRKENPSIW